MGTEVVLTRNKEGLQVVFQCANPQSFVRLRDGAPELKERLIQALGENRVNVGVRKVTEVSEQDETGAQS